MASEFNESNNLQGLRIGGTDLIPSLVSYYPETNGALRVIAQVQNLGAPAAGESVLAIRREGQTNSPLATAQVPALEPGLMAQVALDLPAGTQPEGQAFYRLFANETSTANDVNPGNDTTAFAVGFRVDTDGDGMPDSWEDSYAFLSAADPGDASLDYDGDGMSNLAEYLAGTAPDDAQSYLRLTSIAAGGLSGVVVTWGSVTNRHYTLQRAPALSEPMMFTNITQAILATPPENYYLDTTATNGAMFFYRVRLE